MDRRRILHTSTNLNENATALQEGGLTKQQNQLSTQIHVWEQLQPIYMPGLLQYKSDIHEKSVPTTKHPEDVKLWLPSKVSKEVQQWVCIQDLPTIEEKLRAAQCYDALDSIRNTLKIKSRLVKFKHNNVWGQKEETHSTAIIDRVHEKARATAAKYRAARTVKLTLLGPGEWEKELQVLADADIRAYQDPNKLVRKGGCQGTIEDGQISSNTQAGNPTETEDFSLLPDNQSRWDGTGETRWTLSWIWLTENPHSNQDGDEILQIEWSKSHACAARAAEEVRLVKQEMHRVVEFLKWKLKWWVLRTGYWSADEGLAEGLHAYAHQQSLLQNNLSQQFQAIWKTPLQEVVVDGDDEADEDVYEEESVGVDEEDAIMDD